MQIFNRVRMGLAALLVLGSSVTAMAAPQENAAAYLSQAYTQMDAITSEAFTVNGVAVSPMGQINFAANGKAIVKPQLLLQADMNVTMNGLLGQKLSLATPCYMEETDKAFIAYYQNNGKWVKQTMKKDAKTAGIETIKSSDILPLLRGVELTADTPEERVLKVTVDGQKLAAAARDSVLAQNKGKIVSHETLLIRIWGYDFDGNEGIIHATMKKLRDKLPRGLIRTVKGVGYCLEEQPYEN